MHIKSCMDRVPGSWKKFLKLIACFAVFSTFSNTFINTFLIRATGSEKGVMTFNIILAAVQPFAMLVAAHMVHAKSPLQSQRVGFYCYAGGFLVLALLGERAISWVLWVAALFSVGNGFFYTTYAIQQVQYTNDGQRDACSGVQAAICGLIGIVFPTLTGVLLACFSDFTGYRMIFGMGLAVALLAVYLTTKLDPIDKGISKAQLRKVLHVLLTDKAARAAMLASAIGAFYNGTMPFFMNMLLYSIVKNELVIGVTVTVTSAISIPASLVYARVVTPGNRTRVIVLSLGVMIAATVMLIIKVSAVTLIVFQVLLAVFSLFFMNPPGIAYFRIIDMLPELKGHGGEVHALREFWYGSGRVIGILMTMLLYNMKNGVGLVVMIILLLQVIPIFLMKQMQFADMPEKATMQI